MRKISDCELILLTCGTGTFSIGDNTYKVSRGDILLIKPGIPHNAFPTELPFGFLCTHFELFAGRESSPFDHKPAAPVNLVLTQPDLPEYIKLCEMVTGVENDDGYSFSDSEFFRMLFTRLVKEYTSKTEGSRIMSKALLSAMLSSLFKFGPPLRTQKPLPPDIENILKHIAGNIHRNIPLVEIAEVAHLQPTYVCSLFKKCMGLTISDYTKLYRISIAKRQLHETDCKMAEIAISLGFFDIHHFSRVFKEVEGITPSQYRSIRFQT